VSLDNLIAATDQPRNRLCRACFDGVYPVELPADTLVGKHVLEGIGRRADSSTATSGPPAADDGSGRPSEARSQAADANPVSAGPGGADALRRP
jgi:amidophosphoribosyltransferase